jgi:excinuclease UvrABC nuclease subunit
MKQPNPIRIKFHINDWKKTLKTTNRQALYFFYDVNFKRILYIGKAKNAYNRIKQHLTESKYTYEPIHKIYRDIGKDFCVQVLYVPDENVDLLEREYIKKYKPKYNEMQYDFLDQIRVNLFLEPVTVSQAKVQALTENISLSKLVDKALAFYIREQKK